MKFGKYVWLLFLLFPLSLLGDNLRVGEQVKITSISDDLAEIEVSVQWNNYWKNVYNYDAVYLFGKYRSRDNGEWRHLFLETNNTAHTAGTGFQVQQVNGGRGLFLMPAQTGMGNAKTVLKLKWKLKGNTLETVTRAQLEAGNILVSVQGIEMVFVPSSPFYAGDGQSANAFSSPAFGVLPAEYDIINQSSGYTYSANGGESAATYANRAADRFNRAIQVSSDRRDWRGTVFPAWWQVDFKTTKHIRYFGVSGLYVAQYPPAPAGEWYLEGSANGSAWTVLWSGGPEYWGQSTVSYPVQRAIKVTNPGDYRYYRIRVEDNQRPQLWNDIYIANVAMTETDLSGLEGTAPLLMHGFSTMLPETYPDGVKGFYAMKYELTQEQYVTFLNQLSRQGQYMRTIGGYLDLLKEGEYVFGENKKAPSFRNGITLREKRTNSGAPYVFACRLNVDNPLANQREDGHTLACNYLSVADMLAYADWSGLRPLSELEFEKMCRSVYAVQPEKGSFSWETAQFEPATSLSDRGTVHETVPANSENVNAANQLDGPARSGVFVRPLERVATGNSFWGISDLTGNLNEIYCNTEMYGRQLKRDIQGTGTLSDYGGHRIAGENWPQQPAAYGVRGGDFRSDAARLTTSDRFAAQGYFTSLSERKPTTGVRLGYSAEITSVLSILTLENGLSSKSGTVYDTICESSSYTITGNISSEEACQYAWFRSLNNGLTWEYITGEHNSSLTLYELHKESAPMVAKQIFFRRMVYTSSSFGASNTVGIVIGRGYRMNRLLDTLTPCLASPGFQVTTCLPATFSWRSIDNGKSLTPGSLTATSSYYSASIADIKEETKPYGGGSFELELTISHAGGCTYRQGLRVFGKANTVAPWSGNEVMTITDSDAKTRQIAHTWSGRDQQQWAITSAETGALSMNEASGMLNGMGETMCNITVSLVCADYPDKVYTKAIKETFRDWYFLEPGAPRTLTLLPGTYRMECKGSQGGSYDASSKGGLGGHVWGYIVLTKIQQFHIYVGRTPYNATTGGYNGGGNSSDATYSVSGGGATDIRLTGGAWDNATSLNSRIMVAGGGGSSAHTGTGGAGGGISGGNGSYSSGIYGRGGTQTTTGYNGAWGKGGTGYLHGGGGGGGYYGGGGGYCTTPNCCAYAGGGGSGYVSGYSSCVVHSSGLQFYNAGMSSGVHADKGYVRIEQL